VTTYVRVFAIANPSVVCLSVTFVHPTISRLKISAMFLYTFYGMLYHWPPWKIFGGDHPRRLCHILRETATRNTVCGTVAYLRGTRVPVPPSRSRRNITPSCDLYCASIHELRSKVCQPQQCRSNIRRLQRYRLERKLHSSVNVKCSLVWLSGVVDARCMYTLYSCSVWPYLVLLKFTGSYRAL